jgi:anti-anti-sigma regulatory factor
MPEGTTQVRLEGDCGVERAAEVTEQFRAVLEEDGDRVDLDLSGVTRADVSLQQIVCAAHRSLASRGKRVGLAAPPSEAVTQLQRSGGFGRACMFHRQECPFQGGSGDE